MMNEMEGRTGKVDVWLNKALFLVSQWWQKWENSKRQDKSPSKSNQAQRKETGWVYGSKRAVDRQMSQDGRKAGRASSFRIKGTGQRSRCRDEEQFAGMVCAEAVPFRIEGHDSSVGSRTKTRGFEDMRTSLLESIR
ncbi:hypothetical protein MKZ38_005368 [Zalerion maritima]|uniref:Uncharacterized protein n=1 Tax=Zalerion maritima TaxID=339359 RepID=A0AAD5RXH7_9PEZI|nr:hypothetical protein MKZ38_005368 [Zalerion maritima]